MADPEVVTEHGPCLHCNIVEITQIYLDAGLTVNEALYRQLEAMAALIAGAPTRDGRRHLVADIARQLPGLVKSKRRAREAAGLGDYETMRSQ